MRLIPSALLASALGFMLGPSACGNKLESPYIPASRFPAAYAQALCASLQHCCTENAVSYDYNQCTAGWKALLQKRFDDPNSAALANYDPKAATHCVDLVTAAALVSCAPVPGSIADARAACQTVFTGKKLPGGDCAADTECALQAGAVVRCLPKNPAAGPDAGGQLPLAHPLDLSLLAAGVCVAIPNPASGAPCTAGGANAAACNGDPTQYCDPATLTCLARAEVGKPCSKDLVTSCNDGAYCIASGTNAGICAAAQALGGSCASSVECDITTTCDGTTCVARKLPAASCAADGECSVNVCDAASKKCLKNVIATTAACTGAGP